MCGAHNWVPFLVSKPELTEINRTPMSLLELFVDVDGSYQVFLKYTNLSRLNAL